MSIFHLHGKLHEPGCEPIRSLNLKIPRAKEFNKDSSVTKNILKGENKNIIYEYVQPSTKLSKSLPSLSSELIKFATWGYKCDYRGNGGLHYEAVPSHLDHVLSKHDYPLAQGPLVLPIDCHQADNYHKPVQEVIADRTEFRHEEDGQRCYSWVPLKVGAEAWGKNTSDKETFRVESVTRRIVGTASFRDMSVVFTCNKHGCVIYCPCTVCYDARTNSNTCKSICREYTCDDCNPQCRKHQLKLPRLFDPKEDMYTMITDRVDMVRHVVPHAGIPQTCVDCHRDVLEHQMFHSVFHLRCRFCKAEVRPFDMMDEGQTSHHAFREGVIMVNKLDDRTCATCLSKLNDIYTRKKHEKALHEGVKPSKFTCIKCGKAYMNSNALNYHMKKHETSQKFSCEDCGKQFVSEMGLHGHIEVVHRKIDKEFKCTVCEKSYSSVSNLNKHKKVAHLMRNLNCAFIESVNKSASQGKEIHCKICEKKFSRKDALKRHVTTVHKDLKFT